MSAPHILIVDDEAATRELLQDALTEAGYHVSKAEDGEDGWQIFLKHQPDLVITDIYMPRLNGIMLLRRIRQQNPTAKVIVMTGSSHFEQLILDQRSRPDSFFTKPLTQALLLDQVEHLVGAPSGAVVSAASSAAEQTKD